MKSFVKRIIFSDWWTYIIKCWWFLFLIGFWDLISKSLNCWTKKLKWKRFLFELKGTFIHIILSWCRIFSFETAIISLSGCLTQICFVVKGVEISPDCCGFEMTWWLRLFILKRTQIQSIFSWTYIISAIKRKSSGFIFTPNCACWVEMIFFIRIVMTRPKFLSLRYFLLIFHVC